MRQYLIRRLFASLITLLGISVMVFGAIRLVPGDQITAQLGTEAGMLSQEQRAALERYYGLDRPPVEQYFTWLGNALQGNFGFSIRQGREVLPLIFERFPVTLELAILSVIIALVIGIPIGIIAALRRNTWIDLFGRVFSMLGLSVPNFLLGTMIIYVLSVFFGILPNSGNYVGFFDDPIKNLQQLIFPAITMGFSFAASIMRMTRSAMLEVLNESYVRTARSKGLKEQTVILRHALRNALIPVVTLIGVEFGYLLGGALITEQIFALPGIGRLAINAITQREYALVQGVALFIVINFILINFMVDIIYGFIDPRVSYDN
ncbi:MAG: ABC transporter permease [Anaerolineae bacterium]|nr:ABC transporter permease [Anaerolineae bacterium]